MRAARREGLSLLETAIGDRDCVTWTAPYPLDDAHWRFGGVGTDLYAGNAGVALFLTALSVVDCAGSGTQWSRAAMQSTRYITEVILNEGESLPLGGAMTGLTGTMNGLMLLGSIGSDTDPYVRQALHRGVRLVADRLAELDSSGGRIGAVRLDLLDGLAGVVTVLSRLRTAEADLAFDCAAEQLLSRAGAWFDDEQPLCGAAHGAAGLAVAHANAAVRTKKKSHLAFVRSLMRWEDERQLPSVCNWRDERASSNAADRDHLVAWCHGAAGIGLARYRIDQHRLVARAHRDWQYALRGTTAAGQQQSDTLCHGTFGNVDLFLLTTRGSTSELVRRWMTNALTVENARVAGPWVFQLTCMARVCSLAYPALGTRC